MRINAYKSHCDAASKKKKMKGEGRMMKKTRFRDFRNNRSRAAGSEFRAVFIIHHFLLYRVAFTQEMWRKNTGVMKTRCFH